jgi:hypothetical protein
MMGHGAFSRLSVDVADGSLGRGAFCARARVQIIRLSLIKFGIQVTRATGRA